MNAAGTAQTTDPRAVLSHLSRLRSVRGQADPVPVYRALRSLGEVLPTPWGSHLVTSHRLADRVLRGREWHVPDAAWKARQRNPRWDGYAHRELSHWLMGLNPPVHTRHRRSLGNPFSRPSLDRMAAVTAEVVDELLDDLCARLDDGADADFSEVVGDQLTVRVIGRWMGLPRADHPLLLRLSQRHVPVQELLPTPTQLAEADEAARGLRAYFSELVAERRRAPGDDPVSGWLRTWDAMGADRRTADEAVLYLATFMFIGADTTSTLLPTMISLLHRHPEQWRRLVADPGLAAGAVEETLRFDPPIHVIGRCAPGDLELGDTVIPKDGLVHVMVGCANLDPALGPDQERFDIARPAGRQARHLTFGGGAHYCVGAAMAKQEGRLLLEGLLRRLPDLRVTAPATWASRVAFRRVTGLRVGR